MKWALKQSGFTIVELLIVVVVIAILATITIVSYNGITQNAERSRIASIINTYEKAIKLYIAKDSTLQELSGCLGVASDYPATSVFTQGACVMSGSTASDMYTEATNSSIFSTLSTQPSASLPAVTVDYGGGMIYHYRGIWFHTNGGGISYELQYLLPGNQECPVGESEYYENSSATRCLVIN